MIVFVKMHATGTTHNIDVECSDDIGTFKEKVQDLLGIPPNEQRIIFAGTDYYNYYSYYYSVSRRTVP